MSRVICLVLTFAIVGCAQHVTPFAETGSQPTMPNAGAMAVKPADSVTAHIALKNETHDFALLTVYWSYAADPFWHEEVRTCALPGRGVDTAVVYNHIERGPQIKFRVDSTPWPCTNHPLSARVVLFRAMNFDPGAHFQAEYRSIGEQQFKLCARGGGNKEVCSTTMP